MKKIILSGMMLLFVGVINAQWSFKPEAGMNITKYADDPNAKIGAKIGVAVEYDLPKSEIFSIKSGLYFMQRRTERGEYSQKYGLHKYVGDPQYGSYMGGLPGSDIGVDAWGKDREEGYMYTTSSSKLNRNYLQLPVMANFTWTICDEIKSSAGIGPYIAYGIGGNKHSYWFDMYKGGYYFGYQNHYNPFKDYTYEEDKKEYYINKGYQRFDWGLTSSFGIEYKKISLNLGYELGFGEEEGTYHKALHPRYQSASMTVGYRLGK